MRYLRLLVLKAKRNNYHIISAPVFGLTLISTFKKLKGVDLFMLHKHFFLVLMIIGPAIKTSALRLLRHFSSELPEVIRKG